MSNVGKEVLTNNNHEDTMKNKLNNVTQLQNGFALMELIIVLAVVTILGVLIVNNSGSLFGGSKKNVAQQEVIRLVQEVQQWRINNNDYAGISVAAMVTAGYNIAPISTGTGDNVYGLNVAVASANSDADASMTYQAEASDQCATLIERLGGTDGISGTPTCTGTGPFTFTATIN